LVPGVSIGVGAGSGGVRLGVGTGTTIYDPDAPKDRR